VRTLAELRDVAEPAWPLIEAAITGATAASVLPVVPAQGEQTLVDLQVTAGSALGALALHTGGVFVDHEWLRILGGGEPPWNLAAANGLPAPPGSAAPGKLLIGFDVLGGSYAVNGGDLPGEPGELCSFAPDELAWWPMEMGHGAFVAWCTTDRFATFNKHLRWPGWETEVAGLAFDRGLAVFPFPFTVEGADLAEVERRPAPIAELVSLWDELARQLQVDPEAPGR
jgi:hypothetical protein